MKRYIAVVQCDYEPATGRPCHLAPGNIVSERQLPPAVIEEWLESGVIVEYDAKKSGR